MKILKFIGGLLLFAIAFGQLALAAPPAAKKSSNCQCAKKRKPAVANPSIKQIEMPLRQLPASQRSQHKCPTDSGIWVAFKLRNSTEPAKWYPFIAEEGNRIWFCVGDEARDLFRSQVLVTDTRKAPTIPSPLSRGDGPAIPTSAQRCPFVPDTSPVRAMPTYKPKPDDPVLKEPRNPLERIQLTVTFFADGTVGPIEVWQSPGKSYAEKAMEAARKIKFNPAWENGGPVCVKQTVEYGYLPEGPSSESVKPLAPLSNSSFRNFPRTMRFSWEPYREAKEYLLEVEYVSSNVAHSQKVKVSGTSYDLTFGTQGEGSWRVSVVSPKGTTSASSAWHTFKYER